MASVDNKADPWSEKEKKVFRELDKGIDDLENDRILPHEDTMKLLREKVKSYVL